MAVGNLLLSEYGHASTVASPVNRMMTAFAEDFRPDKDINLGVGYVNEETIPRDLLVEAMEEVLFRQEKYPAALNYGGARGSQNLIDSIERFYVEHGIGGVTQDVLDRKEIIIGPNGATSLLESVAYVVPRGIVITSDPVYYIYCSFLERAGFEVVTVPEDEEGIRTDLLQEKLKELGARRRGVSFFYVVTVSNPTSAILSNERRRALVQMATALSRDLGRPVPLFLDKAYEDLVHDPSVPSLESGLLSDEAGLVYEVGTLSKILAPALRIGYMIGNGGPFMTAMVQKTSDAGFSAPLVTQEIASYMLDRYVGEQIARVNRGYRRKARQVREWIQGHLGPVVSGSSGGRAGFYFYLTFRDIETTEGSPFFRFLARTTGDAEIDGRDGETAPRVIYVPGEFCVHPRGNLVDVGRRQLRLSYGFEELGRIGQAIEMMGEASAYVRNP